MVCILFTYCIPNVSAAVCTAKVCIPEAEETTSQSPDWTPPLQEGKISYNLLFWPYVQLFKAPNVVR